jgi:hypothetical protein
VAAMGGNLLIMNILGAVSRTEGCTRRDGAASSGRQYPLEAVASDCGGGALHQDANVCPIVEPGMPPRAGLNRGAVPHPGYIRATAAGAMLSGALPSTRLRLCVTCRPEGMHPLRSSHPESATSDWRITNARPAPRAERAGTLHPLRLRAAVFSMRAGRLAEPGRRQIAGHPFSNTLASPSAVPTARRRSALFSLPVLTWPAGFGRRAVFSGVRTHA